jgi:hypothetical protein
MFCPVIQAGSNRVARVISNIFLFISLIIRYTLPVAPATCGTFIGNISSHVYLLPPDELLPEEEDDEEEEEDPAEDEPEL